MKRTNSVFWRVRWIIDACSKLIGFLPNSVICFLYDLSSGVPGLLGVGLRYTLLKVMAKSLGDNVFIGRWTVIKNADRLSVGDNVSLHENVFIDAIGGINIGNDVSIAHGCSLVSFEHSYRSESMPIKYQPLVHKSINIGSDVWVGCGARLLAGAELSQRTIVGANSIVKVKCDSGIWVGAPACKVKDI